MTQKGFLILSFQVFSYLKIPDYNNCDPLIENIQEPVLKAIVKYRNHPSILNIEEVCKENPQFSFGCVDKNEILKEILNLDAPKAYQDSDIPSRIIELLRKMLTFSQIFFIPVLIIQFISPNFHQSLNSQMSLLSLKG